MPAVNQKRIDKAAKAIDEMTTNLTLTERILLYADLLAKAVGDERVLLTPWQVNDLVTSITAAS